MRYGGCFLFHLSLPMPVYVCHSGHRLPVCFAEKGIFECELTAEKPFPKILSPLRGTVSNVVRIMRAYTKENRGYDEHGLPPAGKLCADLTGDQIKITAHGISRHAAFPEGGRNAIK
jgi:succinyl-diaminopimelate desuccinylase